MRTRTSRSQRTHRCACSRLSLSLSLLSLSLFGQKLCVCGSLVCKLSTRTAPHPVSHGFSNFQIAGWRVLEKPHEVLRERTESLHTGEFPQKSSVFTTHWFPQLERRLFFLGEVHHSQRPKVGINQLTLPFAVLVLFKILATNAAEPPISQTNHILPR